MKNPVEETKKLIKEIIRYIDDSPWRSEYLSQVRHCLLEVEEPCVLAVAGRVKAGKSSFLNALLGKDLAKVGISETTATINYFRYGLPSDAERPVLIVWENGQETYETKDFLDSLQGNTEEVLKKASGIKRIEFFVNDPILREVTLVDTPGTDAIIGSDGDGHEAVSTTFFRLRAKHNDETRELTSSADAVIYLTGSVANISGQKFIQDFQSALNQGSSAMNAIGVMAKIDLEDGILQEKDSLAKSIALKLRRELNTVIPVSAGIWRAIDRLRVEGRLEKMQTVLKQIPESMFEFMMDMEEQFLYEADVLWDGSDLPPLSIEERKDLMAGLEWRVFVVISRVIYRYPLEESVQRLMDMSGMERLKSILNEHFFRRGRLLRCFRITNDIHKLLKEIDRDSVYMTEQDVSLLEKFRDFVQARPLNREETKTISRLDAYLCKHLKTKKEIDALKIKLSDDLIPKLETLQLELEEADKRFRILRLIEGNPELFTLEEHKELLALFGMYLDEQFSKDSSCCMERQQYWMMESFGARNKERQMVAESAVQMYGQI